MSKFLLLLLFVSFVTVSCAGINGLRQASNYCNKKDYAHQIEEDFRLDVKGYSKTFDLDLKYRDTYSLGITNGSIGFPQDYKFKGKLKLQYLYKGAVVREVEVEKQGVTWDMTGEHGKNGYNKEITLTYFEFPLSNKYKDDMMLRVTVTEADMRINEFGRELRLVIGVSATP